MAYQTVSVNQTPGGYRGKLIPQSAIVKGELREIRRALEHFGVHAEIKMLMGGSVILRVRDEFCARLPKDKRGPYLPVKVEDDHWSGHPIHVLTAIDLAGNWHALRS
jgi:hypothetical protein